MEYMDLIDEQNNVIGKTTRKEIKEKVLLHRSVIIFLINNQNQLFIHKRAKTKSLLPGKWDICFGGAVSSGEEYLEAAKREFLEESGIDEKIKFLFKFRDNSKIDNYLAYSYICKTNTPPIPCPKEIDEGFFIDIYKIKDSNLDFCGRTNPLLEKLLEFKEHF